MGTRGATWRSAPVRSGRRAGLAVAAILLATACDRASESDALQPEAPFRGANLVVGTSLEQWSLLSVPRAGGVAEARDLSDLQRVVWTGTTALPPSVEAHALTGGRIVLRTAAGAVHTYDPPSDALVRVGEVSPDAVWLGDGAVGLYLSPGGSLLEVSRNGIWSYKLEREVSWAAPADGGVLVALDDPSGSLALWLLARDEDEPSETGSARVRSPGVVTAWGRRAVLASADGRGIVVLSVAPIEQAGHLDLGGPVLALAASPSTHEIYAALDDPPRLAAINRFNLTSRTVAELSTPATAVRPSLFGEGILVAQDGQVSRIPVGGGSPVRVGSDWRTDLPVGLPDGRVVTATERGVLVSDLRTGSETGLAEVANESWWLPVHWNPAGAILTADRLTGQAVRTETAGPDAEAPVDSALLAERRAAAPGLRDRAAAAPVSGPPPGFYAIVGSARQREGISSLVQSLQDAGFATEVQTVPDEAGRTWFRGLVGPYRTRSEAEAAARQLLRERRLEAWVTEVGAAARPNGESI